MRIDVDLRGESCLFLALLCLLFPLQWIGAMIFAGFFHELCHALAVMLLGGRIYHIRVGLTGTIMEVSSLCPWKELICALAGPMGSLFLFSMVHRIPYTALCAMVQGLYNLLPIYPLDGGRVLFCLFKMTVSPEKAMRFSNLLNLLCSFFLVFCGILAMFRLKAGILPIFVSVLILSRGKHGKIPCKDGHLGVQ